MSLIEFLQERRVHTISCATHIGYLDGVPQKYEIADADRARFYELLTGPERSRFTYLMSRCASTGHSIVVANIHPGPNTPLIAEVLLVYRRLISQFADTESTQELTAYVLEQDQALYSPAPDHYQIIIPMVIDRETLRDIHESAQDILNCRVQYLGQYCPLYGYSPRFKGAFKLRTRWTLTTKAAVLIHQYPADYEATAEDYANLDAHVTAPDEEAEEAEDDDEIELRSTGPCTFPPWILLVPVLIASLSVYLSFQSQANSI